MSVGGSTEVCGDEKPMVTSFHEEATGYRWFDVKWHLENCGDDMKYVCTFMLTEAVNSSLCSKPASK